MNWIEKIKQRGVAGFSLLELMVVVAILGVLATVAVPRFNIFRARSRQAEAKSNLGVIYTLQESFQIEHERFFNGNGASGAWNSKYMDNANRSGLKVDATSSACDSNKLGFRLANCDKARYGYYISDADENTWMAIAHGPSVDGKPEYRIFPACAGADTSTRAPRGGPGNIKCNRAGVAADAKNKGDAWCMDEGRNLENYRDIVEFCDN